MKYLALFFLIVFCKSITIAQGSMKFTGAKSADRPFIRHIYPSTDRIPVNVLRFYIEFSEPMRDGDALAHIHVIDQKGVNVPLVFFDNGEELWDLDRTKLTLLVDPGRVKTGLKGNMEMGRAFKEGSSYELVVDSAFQSISGRPLRAGIRKNFIAVKADTLAPDLKKWLIKMPHLNTREPLVLNFGKPLDHISALSYVVLTDDIEVKVRGQVILRKAESILEYYPVKKWKNGFYTIMVNSRLEDLSGNNLNGAFNHAKNGLKNNREGLTESLSFEVK